MKTEFTGDIMLVRAVEDRIRATQKYTKGVFHKPVKHPIQGEDFPSKVLTEYYEVYPDMDVNFDMSWPDFWAWVWGGVLHVDVFFHYSYTTNRARMVIHGDGNVVRSMESGIPGLKETLEMLAVSGRSKNGAPESAQSALSFKPGDRETEHST